MSDFVKPLVAAILALLATPAIAQNAGTVGVVTDMWAGDAKMGMDMANALNTTDPHDPMRVLWIGGAGSIQNLKDVLYTRGIDAGLVLSDSIDYARANKLIPDADLAHIQYIAKLWDEEVHILAGPGIDHLADLNGKIVNVDVPGSSSAMTADIVFRALGIHPQIQNRPQGDAMVSLRAGDIAAIFEVAAAPVALLAGVPAGTALHFVPIPLVGDLTRTYMPTEVTHVQYPNLVTDPVPTLAIGDVLAVFGWPANTERYRNVARFTDALFAHIADLQKPPRHPKWRDVNLGAAVPGWTQFPEAEVLLRERFLMDMQRQAAADAGVKVMSPELMMALVKDFEKWRGMRKK